jgi:hypothetical protein
MFRSLLVLALIFSCFCSCCQEYFSNRYDLLNLHGSEYSQDIIEEIDGYTLLVESAGQDLPNRKIVFLSLDKSGNLNGSPVVYYDSIVNIQTGCQGSFIRLARNPGYACVGTKMKWVSGGSYDQGWLLRFNSSMDTIWTKSYTDILPHDTSFMLVNFRELDDKGFIMTSGYANVAGTDFWRIHLFKTDSLGNLKWDKYFGTGNTICLSYDVTPTSDGGYAISGGVDPQNTTSQDADPIIIKTDSIGNQKWIKNLGSPVCCEEPAYIDTTYDGNILAGSTYSDSCSGWATYWDRINLVKLRNDGSVVWDKTYGFSKYKLLLNKVKSLKDSCIVAVGDYYITLEGYWLKVSWILKTDSAGNELWYREYKMMVGDDGENTLYNIIQTSDHGFAACGSIFPVNLPDTGTQDSWVIKVDSLGWTAPGECWVGQEEIEVREFTPDKPFVFYPNPAYEKLTVEFYENQAGAEIEMFDLTGRKVVSDQIAPNKPILELDVGKQQPGLYILKVTVPGKRPVMGKVLVE